MGSFVKYYIDTAFTANGPFVLFDSIMVYTQDTYTHTVAKGANGQNQIEYYQMRTVSGCPGNTANSQPGGVYASMKLDATNPGGGLANINWNPIISPNLPSASGIYKLFREYPGGSNNWTQIASTPDTFYVDTVTLCNAVLNYRVEMEDTLGFDTAGTPFFCSSVSSIDGDLFSDVNAPPVPIIDSVTVIPIINKSFIAWSQNTAPDCQGYIVYRLDAGAWVPIDTIYGDTNITYTDQIADPCSNFQTYNVAAFDSCWNKSPLGLKHNTIKVDAKPDICDDKMDIWWNSYINMLPSLGGYNIYYTENAGALTFLANVSSNDTTYEHIGLNNGSEYCYYIQAFDNGGQKSSTSCVKCLFANKPNQPQFVYLRVATVEDNNTNSEVRLHTDTSGFVMEYKLYRSTDNVSYSQLSSIPPSINPLIVYDDYTAMVNEIAYYYYVIVVDSCGNDVLTSDTARTMFLKVEAKDNLVNVLTWNDYEGWNPAVSGSPIFYDLYRKVDGVLNPILPLTQLSYGTLIYEDDVSSTMLITGAGRFDYFLHAVEGNGNIFSFNDTAQSNIVQALQKPKLFVPNAFTPDKQDNNIFLPYGVFVDRDGYFFQIYNRWGQVVFETEDVNEGWDGTKNGGSANEGVYVYFIKFKNSKGEFFEKRGTVTLLR